MAASIITVSGAQLIYGTFAEIDALDSGTSPAVAIGDVGFATDTYAEYTWKDVTSASPVGSAAVMVLTRQHNSAGAAHTLVQNTAAAGVNVVDANLIPVAFAQVTDVAAVHYIWHASLDQIFGTTLPAGATVALIQCVNERVRWRDDGTNPTTAAGMVLAAGDQFFYTGDLDTIRFISVGTDSPTTSELNITLYKQA